MKSVLRLTILLAMFALSANNLQAQTVQAIHSISDPELAILDVWVQVSIITVDFQDIAFRSALPMTDIPFPGIPINVGIAPGNSTSISDTLKNFRITLTSGLTYAGVVRGVIDPAQFAPNPDGRDTGLGFSLNSQARQSSTVPGEVQFFLVHAVTDAPTIDVAIRNGSVVANNAAYGDMSGYVSVIPGAYVLDVTDQGGNLIAAFNADLTNYADSAMVVFASGFLDPSQNQNGEEFGMFAALPGGNVIEFPKILVGIDDGAGGQLAADYRLEQNYPNPFNPSTTIEFSIPGNEHVTLSIYDVSGKHVETIVSGQLSAGAHRVSWNPEGLPSGIYFYQLRTGAFSAARKLMLLR